MEAVVAEHMVVAVIMIEIGIVQGIMPEKDLPDEVERTIVKGEDDTNHQIEGVIVMIEEPEALPLEMGLGIGVGKVIEDFIGIEERAPEVVRGGLGIENVANVEPEL